MKKWKENKKAHDVIWGKIYIYAIEEANKDTKDDGLVEVWLNINISELMESGLGKNRQNVPYIFESAKCFDSLENCIHKKMSVLCDVIKNNITDNTDLIVDLGSGWGRNSVYLSNLFHKKVDFLACELSDSGRQCTDLIANKYDLPIETIPFNYYDNSNLLEVLKNRQISDILFFSNHSIEQISEIDISFFKSIISLPIKTINFVHLEPVGWQIENMPKNTNPLYNDNLISVLKKLEEENLITITRMQPNYFGLKHINTGALIEWKKK